MPTFRNDLAWRAVRIATVAIFAASGIAKAQDIQYYRTPEEAIAAGVLRDIRTIFTNYRGATIAKAGLDGRIKAARAEFLDGCSRGVRDPALERNYALALQDKDFYYMPFYGGPSPQQALASDRMTGGAVDGGILPDTELSFVGWARAMMATALHADPADSNMDQRADQLATLYVRYVILRNEAEIQAWVKNRKISAGPAVSTPDGIADTYIRMLREAVGARYGTEPGKVAAFQPWIENVRDKILKFENAEPTIDSAVDLLRRHSFPPDIIQNFVDKVRVASRNGQIDQAVLLQAYIDASRQQDRRRGINVDRMVGPSGAAYHEALKRAASDDLEDSIERLVRDSPYPLPFRSYAYGRESIIRGDWYIDAPPPAPEADWCTGKPAVGQK
jgi:hypothetical protein